MRLEGKGGGGGFEEDENEGEFEEGDKASATSFAEGCLLNTFLVVALVGVGVVEELVEEEAKAFPKLANQPPPVAFTGLVVVGA